MVHRRLQYRLATVGLMVTIAIACLLVVNRIQAGEQKADQSVLFSDYFSGGLSQWSDLIGNWSIDQGELYGQGGAEYHIDGAIYAGDTSWTDYSLQAKVIFINGEAQLILRSTGHWQNEYMLDFRESGYWNPTLYQVVKYKDGISYDLSGGVVPSPVFFTNPCIIKVLASGNRLFIFVNDQFMAEIDDPDPLTSGRVGLGMKYNNEIRFDDVLVETLPPILILPEEQGKYSSPGSTVSYSITLQNLTGEEDSFNLDILPGNSWVTTPISNLVGPIPDDQAITFTVDVQIPADAQVGQFDMATVIASSVHSPGYSDTAVIKTSNPSDELAYVAQSNNTLTVIDQKTRIIVGNINVEAMGCIGPQRLRLTPSNTSLYVMCSGSSSLIALHVPDLSLEYLLDLPEGVPNDIAFRPDEMYAFVSLSGQGFIDVLDIQARAITMAIPLEGVDQISNLDFSPSGNVLYAAGGAGRGKIYLVDPLTFGITSIIDHGTYIADVVSSPDGRSIYASEVSMANINIIDASTLQVIGEIADYDLYGLALSPDGTILYGGNGASGSFGVYDIAARKKIKSVSVGGEVKDLNMNCSGSEIYIGSSTSKISIVDTKLNEVVYTISTPGLLSYGIAVCPQYYSPITAAKMVHQTGAAPGGELDYSITAMSLIADVTRDVMITDTLPISITYLDGSLSASSGSASYQDGTITWSGNITPGIQLEIDFEATLSPDVAIGSIVTNQAEITAQGIKMTRSAELEVGYYRSFIACVSRACLPLFQDNFSNPASGWGTQHGSGYVMGYANGEYYIAVNQGWIAWSLRNFGVSDYRVEVDVRPEASLDGGAGIMFGVSDYGFYMFEVSDSWYSLWRVDIAGNYWYWTPLIDWATSPYLHPGNQVNHLTVVRVGSGIAVMVNNQLLRTISDNTYHGTWMGMVTEAYYAYFDGWFDNFVIFTGPCIGERSLTSLPSELPSSQAILISPGGGRLLVEPKENR
jgi:WD40 repeat protein